MVWSEHSQCVHLADTEYCRIVVVGIEVARLLSEVWAPVTLFD